MNTLDAVIKVLRNIGYDVECGSCMELALTGSSCGHPHTCEHEFPYVRISNLEYQNLNLRARLDAR